MPKTYPAQRPTLLDVAKLAGVSHITVSRVVRGVKMVSPETVHLVKQAVKKLGYRPDPTLSALASYRTNGGGKAHGDDLAFLDCDGTPYSRLVFEGVKNEASLLGYGAEFFKLEQAEIQQKRLSRTLYYRGVRGLIFGPSDEEWIFQGWAWEKFAAVSLGALTHHPALHAVAMDYFQGAWEGARILQNQGCRRIGLVIDLSLEARTGHRWVGGYLASGAGKDQWIYRGKITDKVGLKKWAKQEKIDGVLTISETAHETLLAFPIQWIFLNSNGTNTAMPHLALKPTLIGTEGVRLLHHLLLRREMGLPVERKMISLMGTWNLASPSDQRATQPRH